MIKVESLLIRFLEAPSALGFETPKCIKRALCFYETKERLVRRSEESERNIVGERHDHTILHT